MPPSPGIARSPVLIGILAEAVLLVAALLLGAWSSTDPLRHFGIDAPAVVAGLLLALPPFLALALLLRSRSAWATRLTTVVDQLAAPLLAGAGRGSLLLLAAVAGVAEEALFRGVLQTALASQLGTTAAVMVIGVLFGAAHMITAAYALIAGVMGVYLGAVFAVTGNLLVPILVHAAYDFVALLAFRRRLLQSRAAGGSAGGAMAL